MGLCIGLLFAVVSLFSMFSVITRAGGNAASLSGICPRCKRHCSLREIKCENCRTKGSIKRAVLRVHDVPCSFYTCSACNTPFRRLYCECGANVISLFDWNA